MALNTFDVTKTQKGPCGIYVGLAIPAAGAELTLDVEKPDLTENPNAKLIGLTEGGATVTITKTEAEEFFDEYEEALLRTVEQVGIMVKCEATQIFDIDVMTEITKGVGTAQTVTGKKKLKIGKGTITNTGIAVISPTRNDPTKYAVFHIYSGHNVSNVEFGFSRSTRSKVPVEFHGVGIVSRAADDRLGAYWWQT